MGFDLSHPTPTLQESPPISNFFGNILQELCWIFVSDCNYDNETLMIAENSAETALMIQTGR